VSPRVERWCLADSLSSQFSEVVDLSVEDRPNCPILVWCRLSPCLDVEILNDQHHKDEDSSLRYPSSSASTERSHTNRCPTLPARVTNSIRRRSDCATRATRSAKLFRSWQRAYAIASATPTPRHHGLSSGPLRRPPQHRRAGKAPQFPSPFPNVPHQYAGARPASARAPGPTAGQLGCDAHTRSVLSRRCHEPRGWLVPRSLPELRASLIPPGGGPVSRKAPMVRYELRSLGCSLREWCGRLVPLLGAFVAPVAWDEHEGVHRPQVSRHGVVKSGQLRFG
jgi:hypothetical protein